MDILESLVINGMIILKHILDNWSSCVGVIRLAEDTNGQCAIVKR